MSLLNALSDPFLDLVSVMRTQGAVHNLVPFILGTILSATPLLVQVDKIQLNRADLSVNTQILSDSFSVGDTVVLLTTDQQKYILLCVVR